MESYVQRPGNVQKKLELARNRFKEIQNEIE